MRGLKETLAGVFAIALLSGVAGVAAQDKEAVAKDRQQTMKAQGAALGSVKAYLDDKADLAKAQEGATQLASLAKTLPAKFPAGTGMADLPGKSAAKPEIWTEKDKFAAAEKQMADEADKLVAATKTGDKAKIASQFASTGK